MAFGGWRNSVEAGVAVNLHPDSSILPRSVSKGWNGSSKRFLRRLNGYNRKMLLIFRGLLSTTRSIPSYGLARITDHCPETTRWCLAWLHSRQKHARVCVCDCASSTVVDHSVETHVRWRARRSLLVTRNGFSGTRT